LAQAAKETGLGPAQDISLRDHVLLAGQAIFRAVAVVLFLAGPLAAVITPAESAAQAVGQDAMPIKNRNIDVSREAAAALPRSEGDQALAGAWPLYRTERGQEAFNDAMAALQATDGAAPGAKAFNACAQLQCKLSLPSLRTDGWIPPGRIWVSPSEYVLIVHSPRLRDGHPYRRRAYGDMRYFVFHEFQNSTRNTDVYDTISAHSGSVFVPLYMSKQSTDAKGRRFVIVVQVAPHDVVCIHASNRDSAGPGMEVAKNPSEALEPLQGLAGILVATILKTAAPHLEVVNHHGMEGVPMLNAYEQRLAALRPDAPTVVLPFVPALAQRVATAIGRLEDLIVRPGASPRIPIAERGIVPQKAASAAPTTPVRTASALAAYLRANLATLKQLPEFANIIPQNAAVIAEQSPEDGIVYVLDASQQVLGRIERQQTQRALVTGTYVYVERDGAVEDGRPFALDVSTPLPMRSALLAPALAGSDRPMLTKPIMPARRPALEPSLTEPIRPAIRPATRPASGTASGTATWSADLPGSGTPR
jgi:hypothetical protein